MWAHNIIEFPLVGDTYFTKKKAVRDFGILTTNLTEFRVGDICITNDNTIKEIGTGHVTVVADIVKGSLIAVESNYRLDHRVHYGRVIPKDRIYGVLRGNFRFPVPFKMPLELNISILMQYDKMWDSSIFKRLVDKMLELSGNKVKLNIFPLYTSLKNWDYKIYPFGAYGYKIISYEWFKANVLPLAFTNNNQSPQIVLFSINKQQWQGEMFGQKSYPEYGWSYFGTNPIQSLIVCDEGDKSFRYPLEDAFIHYAIHEISHGLAHWGRTDNRDDTDINDLNNQRDKIFNELDYPHLAVNL